MMNKYYFFYLLWLAPLYLLFLFFQQIAVFNGATKTYEEGETYVSEVIDFDIKQIAAQSNGYVVVRFQPKGGDMIERKLSLSIQMAQQILNTTSLPVRYLKGNYPEIVLMPIYELQKGIAYTNSFISALGFIIVLVIAFFASKFAGKRIREGEVELVIERIDQ